MLYCACKAEFLDIFLFLFEAFTNPSYKELFYLQVAHVNHFSVQEFSS
jgi:hypothetical protein